MSDDRRKKEKCSKHIIPCDNRRYRKQSCKDFIILSNNILLNMNYRELYSLRIIGAIGSIIVAAIIAVVVLMSHCEQGFVC